MAALAVSSFLGGCKGSGYLVKPAFSFSELKKRLQQILRAVRKHGRFCTTLHLKYIFIKPSSIQPPLHNCTNKNYHILLAKIASTPRGWEVLGNLQFVSNTSVQLNRGKPPHPEVQPGMRPIKAVGVKVKENMWINGNLREKMSKKFTKDLQEVKRIETYGEIHGLRVGPVPHLCEQAKSNGSTTAQYLKLWSFTYPQQPPSPEEWTPDFEKSDAHELRPPALRLSRSWACKWTSRVEWKKSASV